MIEVNKEPSTVFPGRTMVVIFGPSFEEVETEMFLLSDTYDAVEFTLPRQCPDGRWTIIGHVS